MTNAYITKAMLIPLVMMTLSPGVKADPGVIDLIVKVNITAEVCKVNNNQPVKAEFGDVQIAKLSAAHTSFPISISCDSPPAGSVQMAIKGNASSFDENVLESDISGLGVSITNPLNSSGVDLNTFYDIQKEFGLNAKTGTFILDAGLKSDGKTILTGGEFKASATLVLQMS